MDEPQDHGNSMMKLAAKGSRRNKFPFWRERRAGRCEAPRRRRCRTSSKSGNKADTRPSPPRPLGCVPQARWLCCSLLTYRPGYSSSLSPRQRAWGPAAKWEVISARALSPQVRCPPLASTVLKHPQALAASILATLCGLRVFAVNSGSVSPRRQEGREGFIG